MDEGFFKLEDPACWGKSYINHILLIFPQLVVQQITTRWWRTYAPKA
jgi:hypothetical protein